MAPEAPPKPARTPAPRALPWPRQPPQVTELGVQNWDEVTAPAGASFRKLPQARVPGDSVRVTTSLQDLLWCCMMQSLPQSRLNSCPDKLEDKSCAGVHSPLCSPVSAIRWGGRSTEGRVMCRCQSSFCLLNRSSSGLRVCSPWGSLEWSLFHPQRCSLSLGRAGRALVAALLQEQSPSWLLASQNCQWKGKLMPGTALP